MSTASGRPRPRKSDHILLVDRFLAPEIAIEISKMEGLYGISLREHYGDDAAQQLADVTFLTEAGVRGWGAHPEPTDVACPAGTRGDRRPPHQGVLLG